MNLTVIVATRGRPELLVTTVSAMLKCMTDARTRILIAVDADDLETVPVLETAGLHWDERILISVKPREDTRGLKYQRALSEAPADVYLPAVDCAPIRTPGFDRIILDKAALFPDGIGVVHTPFINMGGFPPALQAVTAKWVDLVGYIYNPAYPFWFIDLELHELARRVGRYFLAEIAVETQQHRPAKTIRLRDLKFWAAYYDAMVIARRGVAKKIIGSAAFLTPDWLKADLLVNQDWIENASRLVTDHTRQNATQIEVLRGEDGEPDAGYVRAKARAADKMLAAWRELEAAAAA